MLDLEMYSRRGPFAVGVATRTVADPLNAQRLLPVEIWYPASAQANGRDIARDNGTSHPFGAHHAAVQDAPPAAGSFPLLLFSHGNSGLRQQSTFLTTHLASWGFVVAAPDHVGNTFLEMLQLDDEQRKQVHRDARRNRPLDLQAVIHAVTHGCEGIPRVETNHIGVLGHSFGGWTAMKMPSRDARVRAVVALAPASEAFVGRSAFVDGELPFPNRAAGLIVAAAGDCLVDLDASVEPLYARLGAPRAMAVIEDTDHFHFCDSVRLIHGNHVRTPRPGLTRPLRPYRELLDEARTYRITCAMTTRFLRAAVVEGADPVEALAGATRLDSAVRLLA